MGEIKKIMVKGMNRVMLDCDTATLLITKNEYTSLKCMERFKLQIHLLSCKYCRRFKKQSNEISLYIHQLNVDLANAKLSMHLSREQKERMISNIRERL
jgi:hypothetical protein